MRGFKKFLALMLSLVMAAGTVSVVNAARFADVPVSDEVLMKAVDLLSSVGITTGTTGTTFGTSEGVTRQQMATFIYRLMKAGKTVEGKVGDNTTSFTDLDDPFYYFMISWANDMGIIKGRSETSFDPKGGIILQDAYVMITRALGYEKKEALAYPFGYIEVAEDIGLDEGLPSNVKYDTALTRGNVAILLYNAFYADMATGRTAYEPIYEEVIIEATGETKLVSTGRKPYTVHDTVAENVFGLKRTVQRIVATPNYSLDSFEKTDDISNDSEMVRVACYDEEYMDTDDGIFGDIDFSTLKLSGTADDYFLIDLSIYYRQEDNESTEIVSASALGKRTKNLSASSVKFETNNSKRTHAYTSNGVLTSEARYSVYTGKVTVNGVDSYLYDAPWSYSKPDNLADKDKDCITLIWLDKTDRNFEDEDYVQDFNFKSHRDAMGRGSETYSSLMGTIYDVNNNKCKVFESYKLSDKDSRGGGLYTPHGLYMATINDLHLAQNYEADVWDSNGDGKIDYMWYKPYAAGVIDIDEGEVFNTVHNNIVKNNIDNFGPIYEPMEVPTIYSYGAYTKDGDEPIDGMVALGYFNGPANYMRINLLTDLYYETKTFTGKSSSDPNSVYLDGGNNGLWGSNARLIGIPNENGARKTTWDPTTTNNAASSGPYISKFFTDDKIGNTYKIARVAGLIFHVKGATGDLSTDNDYAMVLPTHGIYAYTTSVGVVVDGNLHKGADVLSLLIDGQIVDVPVKPQLSSTVAKNNMSIDGSYSLTPVTKKQANDVYDFSDYVGKLLTYTVNSAGQYVLKIAPLETYNKKEVLTGDDADAYYAYQYAEVDLKSTAAFIKTSGNLYRFVSKNTTTVHPTISPASFVTFTENTKVVIMTTDDDGEPVYTIYDYNNKPNFDNSDDLKNIKYIVKNNPNSKTTEELVYLYAEAADGKTGIKTKSTLDFRFIKSYRTVAGNDGKNNIIYYDVYNPFTGAIEKEYEAISDDGNVNCLMDGIYSVSNGYINDKYNLGAINNLGAAANSGTTIKSEGLGLVAIDDYDTENNFLSVVDDEMLYLVNDKTIITFLDLDEGEISVKSDSILNSTSKNYRCNSNGDMPLLAFVASSKVKNENLYEHAELICIVRYNKLGK